jgi:hypothetical protein
VNDQHYRRVAQLWKTIVEDRSEKEKAADRLARLQGRHQAMTGYVAGMIARVLTAMGYEPETDAATGPGEPEIRLDGPWGPAVFSWKEDDTLQVGHPKGLRRIVPLAADLPTIAEARGSQVSGAIQEACQDGVVAYLGPSSPDLASQFPESPSSSGEARAALPEGSLVAVTPVEPTSIERLGRIVFRAVLEPALLAYPPEVRVDGGPVPPRLRDVLAGLTFLNRADSLVTVTRPVQYPDRKSLEHALEAIRLAARRPGWQQEHLRFLQPLQRSILEAATELERLLTCPVCGAQNHPNAWALRSHGTFEVRCSGCESSWGLDTCGSCGDRIPVLDQPHLDEDLHVKGQGWVERIVGRDCLATPCWARTPGRRTFICPNCQECGASRSQAASACPRCRQGT